MKVYVARTELLPWCELQIVECRFRFTIGEQKKVMLSLCFCCSEQADKINLIFILLPVLFFFFLKKTVQDSYCNM